MVKNLVCSECGGKMEEGHIPDFGYGGAVQSSWIRGKPERSFWFGLKTILKPALYISVYRCGNCGFLKFYADSDNKK